MLKQQYFNVLMILYSKWDSEQSNCEEDLPARPSSPAFGP